MGTHANPLQKRTLERTFFNVKILFTNIFSCLLQQTMLSKRIRDTITNNKVIQYAYIQ